MRGETNQSAFSKRPAFDTPYDAYHKIHKRFVGPATADKLVDFYESLSQIQQPREMYTAGWAAAEASLVGTQYATEERARLADAATECWEFALALEQERSALSAWTKGTSPDGTEQYRIASTLALAPIIGAIPRGIIPKQTLRSCQERLIDIAQLNNGDMHAAMKAGVEGRAASYMGVAFEQIATLGINRMMSSRIISLFSLARAGTGFHYPEQTHDIMVLNLDKDNIVRVTPTEVKSQLKVKFSNRYEAALVGGKAILGENRQMIGHTIDLFRRELTDEVNLEEKQFLDSISNSIIHSVRHHHRARQFGRHCLSAERCELIHSSQQVAS